ncbi:MAG: Fur family transcriptional regulator [Bacillota bacterium]|nr:Fur family transcriptional regulator [Bacillota bacterium]
MTKSRQAEAPENDEARAALKRHRIRYTAQRAAVYRVLDEEGRALTAQEVHARLEAGHESANCWLSTVYRTLECFVAAGLAASEPLPGLEASSYRLLHRAHRHFAVCLGCRRLIALTVCPLELPQAELDAIGFKLEDHKVELYGLCADCQAGGTSPVST